MRWAVLLPTLLALSSLLDLSARAQAYRWTDSDGVVHFTDNPYELPEPMRSKTLRELERIREEEKKRRQETGEPVQPPQPKREQIADSPPSRPRLPPGPEVKKLRPQDKQRWKNRMRKARDAVSNLERRCAELEGGLLQARRQQLLFGRPAQAAIDSQAELDKCRQQLAAAKKHLEEELPEKARRAGIPPGWLR
ncbi:MAG: DUF4124 domain-containing protein [Deltaproteobacteria bacterium]|nr:DUF4124 domain-containing protein [Deltaproteobacteria bacterium]